MWNITRTHDIPFVPRQGSLINKATFLLLLCVWPAHQHVQPHYLCRQKQLQSQAFGRILTQNSYWIMTMRKPLCPLIPVFIHISMGHHYIHVSLIMLKIQLGTTEKDHVFPFHTYENNKTPHKVHQERACCGCHLPGRG